ncbi:hypothetical protein ACYJ1Y_08280 [Natrialbaceae archaeon A-gly3]
MAREPSVPDDERTSASPDWDADASGNSGLLDRRSYLKLAGVATAGTAMAAGAASAAADDYEVVEVPAGKREVVNVGSGETLENVLYDISANGAAVTIAAYGSDWTLRNIGIKGRYSATEAVIGAADTGGGTSRIENVYVGDGAEAGHRVGLGIWVSPEHNGHMDIERVNIQEMGDNSFYCSAPGGQGTVDIRNCYSANSWVSHYRLARGTVENCVALNDSRHKDGRGVWAWAPGTVEVKGCDLEMNGRHYSVVAGGNNPGAEVTVEDTQWDRSFNGGYRDHRGQVRLGSGNGTDPDGSRIPEGCPTTPEEAAAGTSSSNGSGGREEDEDDELPHVILFEGSEEGATRYEFSVDGDVEKSTYEGATIDDEDVIEDDFVHGIVGTWRDAFRFSGDLEELTVDGPGTVSVDGEEVDPADYGEDLPHTLEIEGEGIPSSFEITVDGDLEFDGEDEPEDETLVVTDAAVQGSVTEETLRFRFAGAVTDVTLTSGEATVSIDGEEIDPDEYGEERILPHAIVIDGSEADGPSTYAIRVDGSLVDASSICTTDDVDESGSVRSILADWLDVYWFDGAITDLTVLGNADVHVEYNARDR